MGLSREVGGGVVHRITFNQQSTLVYVSLWVCAQQLCAYMHACMQSGPVGVCEHKSHAVLCIAVPNLALLC